VGGLRCPRFFHDAIHRGLEALQHFGVAARVVGFKHEPGFARIRPAEYLKIMQLTGEDGSSCRMEPFGGNPTPMRAKSFLKNEQARSFK
jgi:hypothetical protein